MRKARARWPEIRSRLPNQAGLTSPSDQTHRKSTSTQRKLQRNPVCCSAASAFRHTLREKGSAACHPRGPSRVWQSSRPAIDLLRSLNHCEPGLARSGTLLHHVLLLALIKWTICLALLLVRAHRRLLQSSHPQTRGSWPTAPLASLSRATSVASTSSTSESSRRSPDSTEPLTTTRTGRPFLIIYYLPLS